MFKLMKEITKRQYASLCYFFIVLTSQTVVKSTSLNDFLGYDLVNEYNDDVASDIAIKLKREYSDDLVSDLFASSYDLIKIARVTELDKENRLFHFRIADMPNLDEIHPSSRTKRSKRHVENRLDMLRSDDRVDLVFPLKYLIREKRKHSIDLSELINQNKREESKYLDKISMTKSELSDLESIYESILDSLENDKRKSICLEFEKTIGKHDKADEIQLHVPKEIDFNDHNFKQQWYLINEGQLKIPPMHDLNVKDAWLNGYTGKNITIVIIDDGLDHEHPDFDGKYVIYLKF